MSRRRDFWRTARRLGIGVLILSVIHIPLPQADYHNIRHHDAPGEVCGFHDHLLRWHPSADLDDDVTMLHWHWFVPIVEFGDHHQRLDDEHGRPGPALHAHLGDWPAPNWQGDPVIRPDSQGRLLHHLALAQSDANRAYIGDELAPPGLPSGRFASRAHDPEGCLRASPGALPTLELLSGFSHCQSPRLFRDESFLSRRISCRRSRAGPSYLGAGFVDSRMIGTVRFE